MVPRAQFQDVPVGTRASPTYEPRAPKCFLLADLFMKVASSRHSSACLL